MNIEECFEYYDYSGNTSYEETYNEISYILRFDWEGGYKIYNQTNPEEVIPEDIISVLENSENWFVW